MSGIIFSFLLFTLAAGLPFLPIAAEPVYLSSGQPRAERALKDKTSPPPVKTDVLSLGPRLSAKSAVVVDAASGAVLFENNSSAPRPLASLTKLMTALVFLESNPDLTKNVTMTEADDREGGSTFIRSGESATLADYLAASLIGSANNATMVLARSNIATTTEFIVKMNAKARELGMDKTSFTDPTGLDPANAGTARDLAKLLDAVSKNERIRSLTTSNKATITVGPKGEEREVKNTDQLLNSIIQVTLGKTGYLDEALFNMAATSRLKSGQEVYLIVLGANSSDERFQDAKNLAVWTQSTYEWK